MSAGLALAGFPLEITEAGSPFGKGTAVLPLDQLSALIRRGEVTSVALTKLYLERIHKEQASGGVNAYITIADEHALRQAVANS